MVDASVILINPKSAKCNLQEQSVEHTVYCYSNIYIKMTFLVFLLIIACISITNVIKICMNCTLNMMMSNPVVGIEYLSNVKFKLFMTINN